VCSNTGDAIERIAEAIDQLARDVQAGSGKSQRVARVADIWHMVTALDLEVARLISRYTEEADSDGGTASQ
jgi:hypothetical protein